MNTKYQELAERFIDSRTIQPNDLRAELLDMGIRSFAMFLDAQEPAKEKLELITPDNGMYVLPSCNDLRKAVNILIQDYNERNK